MHKTLIYAQSLHFVYVQSPHHIYAQRPHLIHAKISSYSRSKNSYMKKSIHIIYAQNPHFHEVLFISMYQPLSYLCARIPSYSRKISFYLYRKQLMFSIDEVVILSTHKALILFTLKTFNRLHYGQIQEMKKNNHAQLRRHTTQQQRLFIHQKCLQS